MHIDAYTAEAICKCIGLPSFEHDPLCINATEAIRLLLMPSFHPEVCITLADGKVSAVAARSMIWRQPEPFPVLSDRSNGDLEPDAFANLLECLASIAQSLEASRGVLIDGMPFELLRFTRGAITLRARGNAGGRGAESEFVAQAIRATWECSSDHHLRNALAEAGHYAGISLPLQSDLPRKPLVGTIVLGSADDRAELLEALRKHHDD